MEKNRQIKMEKTVITYGTFDLFHQGHDNLLRRAKALGDKLIVGVTSETYDKRRGKLNVVQSLVQRIENVKQSGYADLIIVEEYEGQKIDDILKYKVAIFAIGSDWINRFDYIKEYCTVIYLERTKGISSTQLRNHNTPVLSLGIIGSGRIAHRFIDESKYVSGIDVKAVYNPNILSAQNFCEHHKLAFSADNIDEFTAKIDCVYIASPHLTHAGYIRKCLEHDKHVLCEKPLTLTALEAVKLFALAKSRHLILMEAIKTAYCPAFQHLISILKTGAVGQIKDIEASFTKLTYGNCRELDSNQAGGSMTELASYVLLPAIKILGTDIRHIHFFSHIAGGIDYFTRGLLVYDRATASFKTGLGVKTEGELIISGTKGYAYVPAPWWKTEYFELRYENQNQTMKYFYKFDGDGLRYEIADFVNQINNRITANHNLTAANSVAIASIIEKFKNGEGVYKLSDEKFTTEYDA
jgi:glycerol-3-phosphate cytidylyltransferase